MKRTLVAVLVIASLAPMAAMAQDGPSFSIIGGYDMSVSGDVHEGAVSPIADLANADRFGKGEPRRVPALSRVVARGARVVLGARRTDRLEQLVAGIEAEGGTARQPDFDLPDDLDLPEGNPS